MPKAITLEMLEAMTPDQRKTLHKNALAMETPAAKEVIALLSAGDLLSKPGAAKKATTAKPRARAAAPKAASAARKKLATHGRQS